MHQKIKNCYTAKRQETSGQGTKRIKMEEGWRERFGPDIDTICMQLEPVGLFRARILIIKRWIQNRSGERFPLNEIKGSWRFLRLKLFKGNLKL